MKIAKGVEMLSISSQLANGPGITHPVILSDNENNVLIDTGLPSQLEQIRDGFSNAGIPLNMLNRIIITHSDMDHIGCLSSIISESEKKIEVISSMKEKPYIECETPPVRLSQMEAAILSQGDLVNPQMKALYESLKTNYMKLKAHVDTVVNDGDILPCCGGIEVVFTPGHTLGHICLIHIETKTLICGDMFNVEKNTLVPAPQFTILDKESYIKSLKKLIEYQIDRIICFHGGLYDEVDIRSRIQEIYESCLT